MKKIIVKAVRVFSWLIALGLMVATIVPADKRPATGLQHEFEHFAAFMLAGITFGFAHSVSVGLRGLLLSAIGFTLLLELSQIFLSTRHARVEDFVVDAVAACVGIVIGCVGRRLIERWPYAVR